MNYNEQKMLGLLHDLVHENHKEMTKIVRNLEQINVNLMQISDNLECLKWRDNDPFDDNHAGFLNNDEENNCLEREKEDLNDN